MSVFEYLTPAEARQKSGTPAREGGITGLLGIVADRLSHPPMRTRAGYSRRPEGADGQRAHGDLPRFKVIDRVEYRNGPEYGPGMAAVVYADGTEELFDYQDFLCVERPIMPVHYVHYGQSRTACGELGKYDTTSTHAASLTCKACIKAVHVTV